MTDDLKNILHQCCGKRGFSLSTFKRLAHEQQWHELSELQLTVQQAYYLVQMQLDDFPKCPVCGSIISYGFWKKKYCSAKCNMNSPETRAKREATCLKKYGVTNVSMNEDIQKKKEITCRRHYGVDYPMQADEVMKKSNATNLQRYGYAYVAQNKEIYQKGRLTSIERYGTEYPQSLENIKEKIRKTNIERYGCASTLQNPDVQAKRRKTCIERYGVAWPTASKLIADKVSRKYRMSYADTYFSNLANNRIVPLFNREDYIDFKDSLHFHCEICNKDFTVDSPTSIAAHCPFCSKNIKSYYERVLAYEIAKFYDGETVRNTRRIIKPLELDFWFPDKNIAIEFNGNYWHSTAQRTDINYHFHKTQICSDKGIRLIHIFEWEWLKSQELCLSYIKDAFGLNRPCKGDVREIDRDSYAVFMQENSFYVSTDIDNASGIYDNDKLVFAAGFVDDIAVQYAARIGYSADDCLDKVAKHAYVDISKHVAGEHYSIVDYMHPSCVFVKNDIIKYDTIDIDDSYFCIFNCGYWFCKKEYDK